MQATNPDTTVLRTLPGPIGIELPIDPALFYTDDESGEGDLYEEEEDTDVDVDLMISWNIQMTGDDEGDDFAPIGTTSIGPIPIRNLFDFKATHWHSLFTRTALQSFDDELATYELLDLDAQGDEDFNLDDSIGEMLLI